MENLLIKSSPSNSKLIKEYALKIGATVKKLNSDHLEDIALGELMDKVKTGEFIMKEEVMEYLDNENSL